MTEPKTVREKRLLSDALREDSRHRGFGAERATIASDKRVIVAAIEAGRYGEMLMDRLLDLEAREKKLQAMMAEGPATVPDVHPNIAELDVRKVGRLSKALARPEDRDEAADAIRSLVERVTLLSGEKRGEIHATLHGEFGAILEWVAAREETNAANNNTPGAGLTGVSVKMVAGARICRSRHELRIAV